MPNSWGMTVTERKRIEQFVTERLDRERDRIFRVYQAAFQPPAELMAVFEAVVAALQQHGFTPAISDGVVAATVNRDHPVHRMFDEKLNQLLNQLWYYRNFELDVSDEEIDIKTTEIEALVKEHLEGAKRPRDDEVVQAPSDEAIAAAIQAVTEARIDAAEPSAEPERVDLGANS